MLRFSSVSVKNIALCTKGECVKEALFNKQNNLRPKLKQYLNNVDEYDYIIVAGPIYFGEYPYEIYSLLDNLNLENKIIKPLVTHE